MAGSAIEKVNLKQHIYVNEELCPVIFQNDSVLFDTVQDGLLRIAKFWWQSARKMFSDFKLREMVLCGDLAGYVYNPFCEVSLGIVVDIPAAVEPYLPEINFTMRVNEIKYKFINRPVHCRFLPAMPQDVPCYSLTNRCWVNHPRKRELSLNKEEICRAFADYQNEINVFLNSLPKLDNNLLTMESCRSLEKFLQEEYNKAETTRSESSEHEYDIRYLLWRTLGEIGAIKYLYTYLGDSYNYNVNVLEQC